MATPCGFESHHRHHNERVLFFEHFSEKENSFFARNLDIRRLFSFDQGNVDFPKSSDHMREIFIPGRHMNTTFRYNVSCNAPQMPGASHNLVSDADESN